MTRCINFFVFGRQLGLALLLGTLATGLGACAKQGQCILTDGSQVNTYQLYGAWKKTTGYSPPRASSQLATDFDVMVIEQGTRMCGVPVVNNAKAANSTYKANYTVDAVATQITITQTAGTVPGAKATYVFGGSCNDTTLTMEYTNGLTETYAHYNSSITSGFCDPQDTTTPTGP